jgi:hypothetical protein
MMSCQPGIGGGSGDPNVFHNSSSWGKIRLHTENHVPMLSGSAFKVCVGGVVSYWVEVGL